MSDQTVEERITTLTFTRQQMDFAVGQIAAMHIDSPLQREIASTMMREVLVGEKSTAEAVSRSLLSEEALIRYMDAAIIFLESIVVSLGRTTAVCPPSPAIKAEPHAATSEDVPRLASDEHLQIQYVVPSGTAASVFQPPLNNRVSLPELGNSPAVCYGSARNHRQDAPLDSPRLPDPSTPGQPLIVDTAAANFDSYARPTTARTANGSPTIDVCGLATPVPGSFRSASPSTSDEPSCNASAHQSPNPSASGKWSFEPDSGHTVVIVGEDPPGENTSGPIAVHNRLNGEDSEPHGTSNALLDDSDLRSSDYTAPMSLEDEESESAADEKAIAHSLLAEELTETSSVSTQSPPKRQRGRRQKPPTSPPSDDYLASPSSAGSDSPGESAVSRRPMRSAAVVASTALSSTFEKPTRKRRAKLSVDEVKAEETSNLGGTVANGLKEPETTGSTSTVGGQLDEVGREGPSNVSELASNGFTEAFAPATKDPSDLAVTRAQDGVPIKADDVPGSASTSTAELLAKSACLPFPRPEDDLSPESTVQTPTLADEASAEKCQHASTDESSSPASHVEPKLPANESPDEASVTKKRRRRAKKSPPEVPVTGNLAKNEVSDKADESSVPTTSDGVTEPKQKRKRARPARQPSTAEATTTSKTAHEAPLAQHEPAAGAQQDEAGPPAGPKGYTEVISTTTKEPSGLAVTRSHEEVRASTSTAKPASLPRSEDGLSSGATPQVPTISDEPQTKNSQSPSLNELSSPAEHIETKLEESASTDEAPEEKKRRRRAKKSRVEVPETGNLAQNEVRNRADQSSAPTSNDSGAVPEPKRKRERPARQPSTAAVATTSETDPEAAQAALELAEQAAHSAQENPLDNARASEPPTDDVPGGSQPTTAPENDVSAHRPSDNAPDSLCDDTEMPSGTSEATATDAVTTAPTKKRNRGPRKKRSQAGPSADHEPTGHSTTQPERDRPNEGGSSVGDDATFQIVIEERNPHKRKRHSKPRGPPSAWAKKIWTRADRQTDEFAKLTVDRVFDLFHAATVKNSQQPVEPDADGERTTTVYELEFAAPSSYVLIDKESQEEVDKWLRENCPELLGPQPDEVELSGDEVPEEAVPPGEFDCEQCDEACASLGLLVKHRTDVHSVANFRCKHCQATFVDISHLRRHMRKWPGHGNAFEDHVSPPKASRPTSKLQGPSPASTSEPAMPVKDASAEPAPAASHSTCDDPEPTSAGRSLSFPKTKVPALHESIPPPFTCSLEEEAPEEEPPSTSAEPAPSTSSDAADCASSDPDVRLLVEMEHNYDSEIAQIIRSDMFHVDEKLLCQIQPVTAPVMPSTGENIDATNMDTEVQEKPTASPEPRRLPPVDARKSTLEETDDDELLPDDSDDGSDFWECSKAPVRDTPSASTEDTERPRTPVFGKANTPDVIIYRNLKPFITEGAATREEVEKRFYEVLCLDYYGELQAMASALTDMYFDLSMQEVRNRYRFKCSQLIEAMGFCKQYVDILSSDA